MASSLNKACLIGNLGRDPEVRTMQNGNRVVSFSLATTESWRDKATGERKDKTEWHNVTIFNEGIGKVAESYCKKGSKVYIEGAIQTREFTDKDGNQRKVTEIVLQQFRGELTLLDSPKDRSDAPQERQQPAQQRGSAPAAPATSYDLNDDIPFQCGFYP